MLPIKGGSGGGASQETATLSVPAELGMRAGWRLGRYRGGCCIATAVNTQPPAFYQPPLSEAKILERIMAVGV